MKCSRKMTTRRLDKTKLIPEVKSSLRDGIEVRLFLGSRSNVLLFLVFYLKLNSICHHRDSLCFLFLYTWFYYDSVRFLLRFLFSF